MKSFEKKEQWYGVIIAFKIRFCNFYMFVPSHLWLDSKTGLTGLI
ncbi:hypothetical protein D3OALGA1CA_5832 [Olavius algarvensis associated proteobacterium Delta 3]|nr:hypothetical protein D3OALGB2SA_1261 [Olavius algarvensis associated proteobacterium Delta 3]CAB5172430.1 hypothetical protein D3OALGA1CA_5832 [Olavius algarvensis associated proteobacterium Delta 3]